MNVFRVFPIVCDAHGCALVVARSTNEALRLVNEGNKTYSENYISLGCQLMFDLRCESNEPYVIFDSIYIEKED